APPRPPGARVGDGGAAAHRREPRPRARGRPPGGEPPRLRGGPRGGRAGARPPGGRARGGRGARRGPARAPAPPLGRGPGRLASLPARARGARADDAGGAAPPPRAGRAAYLRAAGERRARRLPRSRRAGRALRGARRARDRERGAAARRARVPGELAVLRWVPRVRTGGGWGGRDDRGAGLRASRRESRGAAPLTTSSS